MFALSELIDAPWARAAQSDQFTVWRGEADEWKLFLPGPWPVKDWREPPAGEVVVEGTETIRSLCGGEEWKVFTLAPEPLLTIVRGFPKQGHWEDEEYELVEPLMPFLQSGLELLGLEARHFGVDAAGAIAYQPVGLAELEASKTQILFEKWPAAWKLKPPRGRGWTPTWQLLWLWVEAARTAWGTHFLNPVRSLEKTYGTVEPVAPTPTSGPTSLKAFLQQCAEQQWPAEVRLSLAGGGWLAQVVVVPVARGAADPAVQRAAVEALARRVNLAHSGWQGGWVQQRDPEGQEFWAFEVRTAAQPCPDLAVALEISS